MKRNKVLLLTPILACLILSCSVIKAISIISDVLSIFSYVESHSSKTAKTYNLLIEREYSNTKRLKSSDNCRVELGKGEIFKDKLKLEEGDYELIIEKDSDFVPAVYIEQNGKSIDFNGYNIKDNIVIPFVVSAKCEIDIYMFNYFCEKGGFSYEIK